ncbi:hypothetical protein AN958_03800 [Leucoagaricus sp. SymC.cos]|nr:hypothetical protein AN958_03800 [Leucoagaricus sp. SymC.cos]
MTPERWFCLASPKKANINWLNNCCLWSHSAILIQRLGSLQHLANCQKPSPPKPRVEDPPPSSSRPRLSPSQRPYSPSYPDLSYPPGHDSRHRKAEQRAATLRADKSIGEVEPNQVFCLLCQKWIWLRQDLSYCIYPWMKHRPKCEKR